MARCEDFPCCGHEAGCCPDFDESGRQLNMVCVCGAKLPVDNRSSLCASCLHDSDDPNWGDDYECDYEEDDDEYYDEEPDPFMSDAEADADVLRSCGWGTDEDYGYYGDGDDGW